mgnify:CR=1 FL=1
MEVAFRFIQVFYNGLVHIWPILGLLLVIILLGAWIIYRVDSRPFGDTVYLAFITAFTIGYGDLTPQRPLSRLTAIILGIIGVVFTGIIVALAVYATSDTLSLSLTGAETGH